MLIRQFISRTLKLILASKYRQTLAPHNDIGKRGKESKKRENGMIDQSWLHAEPGPAQQFSCWQFLKTIFNRHVTSREQRGCDLETGGRPASMLVSAANSTPSIYGYKHTRDADLSPSGCQGLLHHHQGNALLHGLSLMLSLHQLSASSQQDRMSLSQTKRASCLPDCDTYTWEVEMTWSRRNTHHYLALCRDWRVHSSPTGWHRIHSRSV